MIETITDHLPGTDLAEAKCWRNRWYLKDGRICWGDRTFSSSKEAWSTAEDVIKGWFDRSYAEWPDDGSAVHISQFAMVLQIPVGDYS